jgi:hypothetical protein
VSCDEYIDQKRSRLCKVMQRAVGGGGGLTGTGLGAFSTQIENTGEKKEKCPSAVRESSSVESKQPTYSFDTLRRSSYNGFTSPIS